MRLRNDRNSNNGSDTNNNELNLPQPLKYLYNMRLRG